MLYDVNNHNINKKLNIITNDNLGNERIVNPEKIIESFLTKTDYHRNFNWKKNLNKNVLFYEVKDEYNNSYLISHYQYEIMFSLFDTVISSSEILNKLIPKNEKNKKKYIDKIFQGFVLKEYKSGEVIIPKCNYENKKYIIVLNGDVINTKNNKTKVAKGELFGDEVINTNQE